MSDSVIVAELEWPYTFSLPLQPQYLCISVFWDKCATCMTV